MRLINANIMPSKGKVEFDGNYTVKKLKGVLDGVANLLGYENQEVWRANRKVTIKAYGSLSTVRGNDVIFAKGIQVARLYDKTMTAYVDDRWIRVKPEECDGIYEHSRIVVAW